MTTPVSNERTSERRDVVWAAATQSAEVRITPGNHFALKIPDGWGGASMSIEVKDKDGNWDAYDNGTIATPVAGEWHDLTGNNLGAFESVRFVSNASFTGTGELRVGV